MFLRLVSLTCALLSAALAEAPRELATKVPQDRRPLEIVGSALSVDRSEATITLRSTLGIFAFNLDLAAAQPSRLVITAQKERFCEGLDFIDHQGVRTELRTARGVTIKPVGGDLVIEISPPALDIVRKGGRVEFVNQYR